MKRITTLTGPSCSGKSTLENMMVERGCLKAVSTTTRAPRAGEVDGVDYYFLNYTEFAAMQDKGGFVECVKFGENWYGLTSEELGRLFELGDHIVLVCEPTGAKQVAKWCAQPRIIGVTLLKIFVDNAKSVINERFLTRFGNDLLAALTKGDLSHHKVITDASKRMGIMTTVEQQWIAEAYMPSGDFRYDAILPMFTEKNSANVAQELCKPRYASQI